MIQPELVLKEQTQRTVPCAPHGVGDGGMPDRAAGLDTQESPRATPATAAAGDTGMDLAEAQTRGREKVTDHFPARRPRCGATGASQGGGRHNLKAAGPRMRNCLRQGRSYDRIVYVYSKSILLIVYIFQFSSGQ